MARPKGRPKRNMNFNLDADLAPWLAYAASMDDTSQTEHINDLLRAERDAYCSNEEDRKAYERWGMRRAEREAAKAGDEG